MKFNEGLPGRRDEEPGREISRRDFLKTGGAALVAAIGGFSKNAEGEQARKESGKIELPISEKIAGQKQSETIFEKNKDYFKIFTTNGDFLPNERKKRIKQLARGIIVLEDVDLSFYLVRTGDTISSIRASLAALPQFAYLRDQTRKIESFNIPPRELQAGMWLPIPLENEERYITDEQFAIYAARSLLSLRENPLYGQFIREALKRTSEQGLIATLVAIAKQEAGGQPIGRFELHRWEPRYNVFSFSLFHILMTGPGLAARRHLNRSEGQLYHPEHAVGLFFGFLKEKNIEPTSIFPLDKKGPTFARVYNGKAWKRVNPNYVKNIYRYYKDAKEMLDTILTEAEDAAPGSGSIPVTPKPEVSPIPKEPTPPKSSSRRQPETSPSSPRIVWEVIGRQNLTMAVKDAHFRYVQATRQTVFRNNQELQKGTQTLMRYLSRRFGSNTYYPNEEVAVGYDRLGKYIMFRSRRNNQLRQELIRLK